MKRLKLMASVHHFVFTADTLEELDGLLNAAKDKLQQSDEFFTEILLTISERDPEKQVKDLFGFSCKFFLGPHEVSTARSLLLERRNRKLEATNCNKISIIKMAEAADEVVERLIVNEQFGDDYSKLGKLCAEEIKFLADCEYKWFLKIKNYFRQKIKLLKSSAFATQEWAIKQRESERLA